MQKLIQRKAHIKIKVTVQSNFYPSLTELTLSLLDTHLSLNDLKALRISKGFFVTLFLVDVQ